ncbi:MAG TPA: AAA family ATPase [Candidatus Binatia bacterium]|nr:AAA family ATPase [Candidatus Binatia bacterium]
MELPPLIAAMVRPNFYPHRPATVELVQTHISYVLLAGDDVYKIKKPVRFTFLDFSSLERRHHFCREEVRLNRRLAADVYHGVVAIASDRDQYALAPEDQPGAVEYAVHMRRLPDDRLLDHLLEHGEVSESMIDRIAARLAAFHREADGGPIVRSNGDPAAIWGILEDNYTGVRPFRDRTIPAVDDDAIHDFSATFLRREESLFRERQTSGRIRDCHGDLHSEHVCFTDGLVIFDCIEFNQQFRYCDVASEIAFLAMDLDYHDRPDLAARLIASYVEGSGDNGLPRLMGFYRCYRAYVRGKVDSLKSVEPEVGETERAAARASAERHFALAYRYTWSDRPLLVAMCGLSGSGKSMIAAKLHERTGFTHLSSDVIRKQIAGAASSAGQRAAYDQGLYTPEQRAATYDALCARAGAEITAGRGVIVDATFQRRRDRDTLRAVAGRLRVPILFVECLCPDAVIRERLAKRGRETGVASDADWNVYVEQRARFEPLASDAADDHVVVDTDCAPGIVTRAIEDTLRARQ